MYGLRAALEATASVDDVDVGMFISVGMCFDLSGRGAAVTAHP